MDETLVDAITKAIGYAENGGRPDLDNLKAGKTGEMASIFQFTPDTWKVYSTEVFGKPTELSHDAETYVVKQKVAKWLEKGYKPEQIASMWNAGVGEPDAYGGTFSNGQPSKGINKKYGVAFDVPAYAKKVMHYVNQFSGKEQQQPQMLAMNNQTTPATMPSQPTALPHADPLADIVSKVQSRKSAQAPQTKKPNPIALGLLQSLANASKSTSSAI